MAETVQLGSGSADQPVPEGVRPMKYPAPPLVIEKDGFRLIFNEPREQGCITLERCGGGILMFFDDDELERISKATWYAAVRIRANRKAGVKS